jgi:glutamyl-tRNA synthetase
MPEAVRVRFAPSPTGEFHVGGGRSALWNWLYARQHGGTFVLRIEDTDLERNQPEWVEGIRAAMRWLELDWDEEYLQSANRPAHEAAAARLHAAGRAYYCDCTAETIAARRPPGAPPGYDGHCRDRGLAWEPGRALRFRIPEGVTIVDDIVRGRVEFDNTKIGGDFVILRGNGSPLFYLAVTVDDLDERITHVLRAEEHLPNTPKNQLLWEALTDLPPPRWAHLPILVDEKRQKLSKRTHKLALESYRDEGFLMEALRNYLCLLGWAPTGDREFLTLEEMLAEFRLEDVNSAPAFFDVKKLTSFNEHYLRALSPSAFLDAARPFLERGPWEPSQFDAAAFERLAPAVQQRARTLADVPNLVDFLFLAVPQIDEASWEKAVATNTAARPILTDAQTVYATVAWAAESLHQATLEIAQRHDLALAKAQAPIRVAITGRTVGPPLFESLEVLGRDRTLARLDDALRRL